MKDNKVEIAKQLSINGGKKCTLGANGPQFKKPGHGRINGDKLTIQGTYEYDRDSEFLFTELTAVYTGTHDRGVKFEEKLNSAEINE